MSAETSLIVVKVEDAALVDHELQLASAVLREKATLGPPRHQGGLHHVHARTQPRHPVRLTRELDLL
jgi:hypothetical protein